MNAFLVFWETGVPGYSPNGDWLEAALMAAYPRCKLPRLTSSVVAIVTNDSARAITQELVNAQVVKPTQATYIIAVSKEFQAHVPAGIRRWLDDNLQEAATESSA